MEKPTDDSEHSEVSERFDEIDVDELFGGIGFLVDTTQSKIESVWKIASGLCPPLDDQGDPQLEYTGDFDTYIEDIWRQSDMFLAKSLTEDLPELREIASHLSMMGNLLADLRHTWATYRYSEELGGPPPPNLSSKRRIAREYFRNAYQVSYIPTIQALARLDIARRSSPIKTSSAEIHGLPLTEREAVVDEIIREANRKGRTITCMRILQELDKLREDEIHRTTASYLRTTLLPDLKDNLGLENQRTKTGKGEGYYYPELFEPPSSRERLK